MHKDNKVAEVKNSELDEVLNKELLPVILIGCLIKIN